MSDKKVLYNTLNKKFNSNENGNCVKLEIPSSDPNRRFNCFELESNISKISFLSSSQSNIDFLSLLEATGRENDETYLYLNGYLKNSNTGFNDDGYYRVNKVHIEKLKISNNILSEDVKLKTENRKGKTPTQFLNSISNSIYVDIECDNSSLDRFSTKVSGPIISSNKIFDVSIDNKLKKFNIDNIYPSVLADEFDLSNVKFESETNNNKTEKKFVYNSGENEFFRYQNSGDTGKFIRAIQEDSDDITDPIIFNKNDSLLDDIRKLLFYRTVSINNSFYSYYEFYAMPADENSNGLNENLGAGESFLFAIPGANERIIYRETPDTSIGEEPDIKPSIEKVGNSFIVTIPFRNNIPNTGNAIYGGIKEVPAGYILSYSVGLVFTSNNDNTNTCVLTGIGTCNDDHIFIPKFSINNGIKETIISIGDSAFRYCSGLTSVTIPNSVTSIGSLAFAVCSDLTSIKIGNGVKIIRDNAFAGCSRLSRITIPNGVISIGDYAFERSGLTNIIIPNSITEIGAGVFDYCPELIIYYSDTTQRWSDITDSNWDYNLDAYTVHCTDGDIVYPSQS